jgi:ubiquinone/menaquinone biosynthesis C-methylase UbiE
MNGASAEAAMQKQIEIQRSYYAQTAEKYDDVHINQGGEHNFALHFMLSMVRYLGIKSILDVGSGTGRVVLSVKSQMPDVQVLGIEPSPELRKVGYSKGLSEAELIDGDAMKLAFPDRSFDLVCEFGALHHIPKPALAVAEMLRVSRTAIFLSDVNNFGRGSARSRLFKQAINAVGLWPLANRIKTRGKGYLLSPGDGLTYSYSLFNDYRQIRAQCNTVHLVNTVPAGANPYRTSSDVALLGIKSPR